MRVTCTADTTCPLHLVDTDVPDDTTRAVCGGCQQPLNLAAPEPKTKRAKA